MSPWASKATDIARNCGLPVRRIERMTQWRLRGALAGSEREAAAALLHDRMTESVLPGVQAARALGLPRRTIILRHILPNSLTPVLAFLPFRMSAAIVALASLDFLGLGVSDSSPSLGELLAQGKNNLDAWWIALPTFGVLVGTLLLLIFIGEALRDALDPRKR